MILLLGVLVGAVMGLVGAGGSVLAVPLLMAYTGGGLHEVAPIALLTIALSAAFGASMAWRHSLVRYRAAGLIAIIGACTAPVGLIIAARTSSMVLTTLFAVILSFISIRLWRQATLKSPGCGIDEGESFQARICTLNEATGRLIWTGPCALCIAVTGAVAGFLSGLLGVGGGFFIVPALNATTRLSIRSTIGTSLMAIALTSSGTVIVAMVSGYELHWSLAMPFTVGAFIGVAASRLASAHITDVALQRGFATLVTLVALWMLLRAVGVT